MAHTGLAFCAALLTNISPLWNRGAPIHLIHNTVGKTGPIVQVYFPQPGLCRRMSIGSIHSVFAYYSPTGVERSSSTRMRLSGKACYECRSPLPPPFSGRETLCPRCAANRQPRRKIYMYFMLRQGWHVQFLEVDLKTPLGRTLTFVGPEKIREIYDRFGTDKKLEDRSALEYAIKMGRGSIWLSLTEEQYQKLRR